MVADPDRPGAILDQVADVALVFWLLGSAVGEPEAVAAIHGPRLERLLEKLVDTPGARVRLRGGGPRSALRPGGRAPTGPGGGRRWRIPVAIVDADPGDWEAWTEAMLAATERLLGGLE